MCKYIEQVIFPRIQGAPCAVMVDSYTAHLTEDVAQVAFGHNVDLIVVPRGQTPIFQPLDISFNADFKQRRNHLYSEFLRDGNHDLENLGPVVRRTVAAYTQVSQKVILKGWNAILCDP